MRQDEEAYIHHTVHDFVELIKCLKLRDVNHLLKEYGYEVRLRGPADDSLEDLYKLMKIRRL